MSDKLKEMFAGKSKVEEKDVITDDPLTRTWKTELWTVAVDPEFSQFMKVDQAPSQWSIRGVVELVNKHLVSPFILLYIHIYYIGTTFTTNYEQIPTSTSTSTSY